MPKFRKKPVVVDAWQWRGSLAGAPEWLMRERTRKWIFDKKRNSLSLATPGGVLHVGIGAWVVRGVRGELHPVADDIFRETYEPVSGGDDANQD